MTKLNDTKFDKIRNSNFDKTQKIKLRKKSKTQIVKQLNHHNQERKKGILGRKA